MDVDRGVRIAVCCGEHEEEDTLMSSQCEFDCTKYNKDSTVGIKINVHHDLIRRKRSCVSSNFTDFMSV